MKEFVVNGIVNYIISNQSYSSDDTDKIKYGVANLYLQISKLTVITLLAIIFKIFIPYLIFTFTFYAIRSTAFGLHSKKSYQCWIWSILIFIGIPYLCTILNIVMPVKIAILIFVIIYISIYSPADTAKRPIVSPKRRIFFKYCSTMISVIYAFFVVYLKDQIVANSLLFSLVLQCFIISPVTYKMLGMTYNNYKRYKK